MIQNGETLDSVRGKINTVIGDVGSMYAIAHNIANVPDATVAIQSIIDNSTNSKIYLPSGVYRICGNGIAVNKRVEIIGNDTTINIDGLNDGAFAFSFIGSYRRARVKGLNFTSSTNRQSAIYIQSHDMVLIDCGFNNIRMGVMVDGFNGTIIEKCFFNGNNQCIQLKGTSNKTTIKECDFFNSIPSVTDASILMGDGLSMVSGINISDCWFELNQCMDILINGPHNIHIHDSWMESFGDNSLNARIKMVSQYGSYRSFGNVVIDNIRFVVSAGTQNIIDLDVDNVTVKNISCHQDGETPNINLRNSKGCLIEKVQTNGNDWHESQQWLNLIGGINITKDWN